MRIFYSWQSDLPEKTNRYFIRDSLEKAIRRLNKDSLVDLFGRENSELELDHDTKGVRGTPDIAATIFEKVRTCDVFIADVSIVGRSVNRERPLPNPNVLIELGYAFSAIGSDRVVLIMDVKYGGRNDLPFDLRHKREPIQFNSEKLGQDNFDEALRYALKPFAEQPRLPKLPLSANPSLSEILAVVSASDSSEDWLYVSGPSWKEYRLFRNNVNLRFEMDFDENGQGCHKQFFKENWAMDHPDDEASSWYADLYFGPTLVKRFILVSVDGSRSLLPMPKVRKETLVFPLDYKVAKIHDANNTLDEYMFRSGLCVVGQQPPAVIRK